MKVVVISDSHGNIANLKHVLGFAKKIKAGAIIHCGDWDNIETVNTVLSFGISLYAVLGNADIDSGIARILFKNSAMFNDQWLTVNIENKKIGVVHSFLNHKPSAISHDVVFTGHRHRQREFAQDGIKIVNPGALEKEINFAVYDTETNEVEFINEQI